MKSYRKSLLLFAVFLLLFQTAVVLVVDLKRPFWEDEWHFVATIRSFGEGLTLDTIKHYEEMSTPLPFVLYSLWGRLVGFELHHLRLFSIIIGLVVYLLFHRWLFEALGDGRKAFFGAVFLAVHPYMIGLSVFVYTDMLTILFLIGCFLAVQRASPLMLAVSGAGALMCRQYAAFLLLAAGVFYLLKWMQQREIASRSMLFAILASAAPLLILFMFWGGICPDNECKNLYLAEGFGFVTTSLSLYICLLFIYLLPVLAVRRRQLYNDVRVLLLAFVISWSYWLSPVTPSVRNVVGFFHRFLELLFGATVWVDIAWFLAFFLGLPVVWFCVRDCRQRLRRANFDLLLFLDFTILAFLLIMPFSYFCWEKYFMLLVPPATIRILLIPQE